MKIKATHKKQIDTLSSTHEEYWKETAA